MQPPLGEYICGQDIERSIEVDGPAAFPIGNRLHGKMRTRRHRTQEEVQPNLKAPAGEVARVVRSGEPLQVDARRDMVCETERQIVVRSSARVGIVRRLERIAARRIDRRTILLDALNAGAARDLVLDAVAPLVPRYGDGAEQVPLRAEIATVPHR